MRSEILLWHETSRLTEDGPACARVQFRMSRNRQCLDRTFGKDATKFDVASLLRVNRETEATENCDHLRP
jgi:hypothetical protein